MGRWRELNETRLSPSTHCLHAEFVQERFRADSVERRQVRSYGTVFGMVTLSREPWNPVINELAREVEVEDLRLADFGCLASPFR